MGWEVFVVILFCHCNYLLCSNGERETRLVCNLSMHEYIGQLSKYCNNGTFFKVKTKSHLLYVKNKKLFFTRHVKPSRHFLYCPHLNVYRHVSLSPPDALPQVSYIQIPRCIENVFIEWCLVLMIKLFSS